jgi:hypothetical protein
VVVPVPRPFSSSHAMMRAFASPTDRPSRLTSSFDDAVATPSPVHGSSSPPVTTRGVGRPNAVANSKSRSSCAGTAMMAPVP